MRVLVAGGTGFIGQAIVQNLLADHPGAEIAILARTARMQAGVRTITCDWERANTHPDVIAFAPQIVINAVGSSHPRASMGHETAEIASTILPFFQLLDQLKPLGLRHVVFVSSAGALYQSALNPALKLQPDSAYFSAKIGTEHLLTSWSAHNGISSANVRVSNPVGLNSKVGFGVVNHFARAIANGDAVQFLGDYDTFKDYIDVRDVGQALTRIAMQQTAGTFDLGSGYACSAKGIHDVLQALAKGKPVPDGLIVPDALRLEPLKQAIGWTPCHDLQATFAAVLDAARADHRATG